MKWIWRAYVVAALGSLLALSAVARDMDRDGMDDVTGDLVPSTAMGNPLADGPIHMVNLDALGIVGANSATWESDGVFPAPNGATGYLWVGNSWDGVLYKVDTTIPSVVATFYPGVIPDGLGWDGQYLLVHSSGGLVHQVDPHTGAVVNSVPSLCGGPHGISWKAHNSPWSDQWMFEPDFSGGTIYQVQHFTSNLGNSWAGMGSVIGSVCDGWRTWISDFGSDSYHQYDIDTGGYLTSFYVGTVNGNPRDGTWDGHHLWDVTWQPTSWAWQWDLVMYDITICPNPKYQMVDPGGMVVIKIGIKNHTGDELTVKGKLEVYNCQGMRVFLEGPRTVVMHPNQVRNVTWTKQAPPMVQPGIYKVRLVIEDLQGNEIHEDWCVVEVD